MSRNTKQTQIASDTSLKEGIDQKYAGATWLIQGQPHTTADVDAVLDKRIEANKESDTAHADWRTACATAKTVMHDTAPVVHAVEQRIRAECGNDPAALAVFGLKPVKKRTRTVKEKAQAADKAVATRKRHDTMGSVQKKEADKAAAETPAPAPAPATPPKQ
jgi:hypothetical protein